MSDERVSLHAFTAWVCRSPLALGVPDPSAERRCFALTAIHHVLSIAGEGRNSSVNINISVKQPQDQRRAEFPLLHMLCPSSRILILPGALSQARNVQRDDFSVEHEPAEVSVSTSDGGHSRLIGSGCFFDSCKGHAIFVMS